MARYLLAFFLLMGITALARADEPKKPEPEKIPAPKVKIEPPYWIVPQAPRTDTREVWQHYGVNQLGRFVPRVIVLPYGAYYSRNLQAYPWPNNRTTAVLPIRVN
jgi:hypothetical protein